MAGASSVHFDDHGLIRRLKAIEAGGVRKRIAAHFKVVAEREVAAMKHSVSGAYAPGKSRSRFPRKRRGDLMNAIRSKVSKTDSGVAIEIGIIGAKKSVERYAVVQELGTVGAGGSLPDIKAKSKLIMIPQEAALDASGNPKFKPRQASNVYEDVFFKTDKSNGSVLMFGKNGETAELIFVGVKRVAIPPRPFVSVRERHLMGPITRYSLLNILRSSVTGG